ncbi:MAG: hypothetical protein AAFY41_14245, partial [Bacteroidota bacterium]
MNETHGVVIAHGKQLNKLNHVTTKNQKTPPSREELLKEYEDFLYIVSHDFRGPLNNIHRFTQLLMDRVHDQN